MIKCWSIFYDYFCLLFLTIFVLWPSDYNFWYGVCDHLYCISRSKSMKMYIQLHLLFLKSYWQWFFVNIPNTLTCYIETWVTLWFNQQKKINVTQVHSVFTYLVYIPVSNCDFNQMLWGFVQNIRICFWVFIIYYDVLHY